MRYAVLGDIHGNLQALNAVLDDMKDLGVESILCVGDVVGYGANPVECLQIMRERDVAIVAGNHDWAALGKVSVEYFNADARDSMEWTCGQLSRQDVDYLESMPLVEMRDCITLVHSNPFGPEYFDYIQTLYDVMLTFQHLETPIAFVGHSHVPVMFSESEPLDCFLVPRHQMEPGVRMVVNVGSVGQPRDLDPRASYTVYDEDERIIHMRRVEYDIHGAAEAIRAAGLPSTNAARLELGR